jgi:hypothetical protein
MRVPPRRRGPRVLAEGRGFKTNRIRTPGGSRGRRMARMTEFLDNWKKRTRALSGISQQKGSSIRRRSNILRCSRRLRSGNGRAGPSVTAEERANAGVVTSRQRPKM